MRPRTTHKPVTHKAQSHSHQIVTMATPSPLPSTDLMQIRTDTGSHYMFITANANGASIGLTTDAKQCNSYFRALYSGERLTTGVKEQGEYLFILQHPTIDSLYVKVSPLSMTNNVSEATDFYSATSSQFFQYRDGTTPHAFCVTATSDGPDDIILANVGTSCNSSTILLAQPVISSNFNNCLIGGTTWLSKNKIITMAVLIPVLVICIIAGAILLAESHHDL